MTFANIEPIPERERPGILGVKTMIIGNLLTLVPAVLFFGGFVLIAWDLQLFPWDQNPPGNDDIHSFSEGILTAVGVLLGTIGALWAFRNTTWLANVYLRRLTRQIIRSRVEAVVQAGDPDAIFVEIVPPENCRLMLETATDVGLFKIDAPRREVLFEGGLERMRIPAKSLVRCGVAKTNFGAGTGFGAQYYFIKVVAQTPAGTREILFAPRGDFGQWGAATRLNRCRSLQTQINEMAEDL